MTVVTSATKDMINFHPMSLCLILITSEITQVVEGGEEGGINSEINIDLLLNKKFASVTVLINNYTYYTLFELS